MCHICRRLGYTPPQPVVEEDDEAALAEAEAIQLASVNPPPPTPRKQIVAKPQPIVITEPAPSYHDAAATTSTWAAYAVPPIPGLLQGDNDDNMDYSPIVPEEEKRKHRPVFGLRIYDAAADASPARAELLARRISALTREERVASESAQEDRIEVVSFPLSLAAAAAADVEVERMDAVAAACIAHSEAERAARLALLPDAGEAASWYVADDLVVEYGCRKRLWVVDGLAPSWEETLRVGAERWRERNAPPREGEGEAPHLLGHFLDVRYDRTAYDGEEDEEREMEGLTRREFFVRRRPLDTLGEALADFRGVRGNVHAFYTEHFSPHGVLDGELAAAREATGATTA